MVALVLYVLDFKRLKCRNNTSDTEKDMTRKRGIVSVFISYSHKDAELAEKIKKGLEAYGLSSFVAHDDIPVGEKWQEKIKKELSKCDVFILILSEDYKVSDWADQEAGYACVADKLIIPINAGKKPYGFINEYQAKNINLHIDNRHLQNEIEKICYEIVNKVYSEFGDKVKDEFIRAFLNSKNFDEANRRSKLLDKFSYSDEEISMLLDDANSNEQIKGAFDARRNLKKLAKEYGKEWGT